jgi:hypothetical protein
MLLKVILKINLKEFYYVQMWPQEASIFPQLIGLYSLMPLMKQENIYIELEEHVEVLIVR